MGEKSKYDTNPLDPETPRRAAAAWGDQATRHLPPRDTKEPLSEDAPTRRYEAGAAGYAPNPVPPSSNAASYAPYPPYQTPPGYQYPPFSPTPMPPGYASLPQTAQPPAVTGKPTSRTVAGLNLPENILLVAPYLPLWYLGAAAGLIVLFMTPRTEKRVRFHAAQGLALQLAFIIVSSLSGVFGWGGHGLVKLMAFLVSAAMVIFPLVYLLKVWKGQEKPIEVLAQPTTWLEEQITPRT